MYPLPDPTFSEQNTNPTPNENGGENSPATLCRKIIQDAVIWSMGAGLIPLPLMDVAAVSAIQMDMVRKICNIYGQNFSEVQAKAWVSALGGSVSSRLFAEGAKLIPGVGQVLGGLAMSALSGASTYGIGKVFCKHFEGGGNLMNFDPAKFRTYFIEQLKIGKEYVVKLKNKQKTSKKDFTQPPGNNQKLVMKLRELSELKALGIISEAEFDALKLKLLSQFH
jgi:uncharacterized protein (DUF697 family)